MHTLEITDFKCISTTVDLTINRLTILAGCNSAGKSSVLQALKFLHLAYNATQPSININFEAECSFGEAYELLNVETGRASFKIELYDDVSGDFAGAQFFAGEEPKSLTLDFVKKEGSSLLPVMEKEIYCLDAERLGPRSSGSVMDLEFLNTGIHGEHTAQLLSRNGYRKVDERRCLPGLPPQLLAQTRAWLSYILPGTDISAKYDSEMQRAQIRVSRGNAISKMATNVGFGVSYLLPVIVECLVAKEDRLVMIENPEAHLHPAAQTKAGEMLAHMALAGLTIIVETHSEHLIEGVQLQAARNPELRNKVTVNFFNDLSSVAAGQRPVKPLSLERDFSFNDYPKGFLDESANSFHELRKTLRK